MPRSRKARLGGFLLALTLVLYAVATTGCATIIHGSEQYVGIATNPPGATITIDGIDKGTTPLVLSLSRKHRYIVWMKKPGFHKASATITRSVSAWIFGNILFGGLIGLAVDAISGGIYFLEPEQISIKLVPLQATPGSNKPTPATPGSSNRPVSPGSSNRPPTVPPGKDK